MTTQARGYPFEVILLGSRPGAVLAGQVKSPDWVGRKANYKGKARPAELASLRAKIATLAGS
jgi:mRNA interferase MazF